MRIGLISDTHGLLRPEAVRALQGSDCIVHAGDIGARSILDALGAIAPVIAIRGNNDMAAWAAGLPDTQRVQLGGVVVYVLHDLKSLPKHAPETAPDVLVSGHSHKPAVERRADGVLLVNPGSAGPRRFKLPVAVGRLLIRDGQVEASIVPLSIEA